MIRKRVRRFSENHALGLAPRDHAQSRIENAAPIQRYPVALWRTTKWQKSRVVGAMSRAIAVRGAIVG
jgi:hypothetical protein